MIETGESVGQYVERLLHEREERYRLSRMSPTSAAAIGMPYNGPAMADKGLRDGSCNRAACQLPLAGRPQFTMPSYTSDALLHYCGVCEKLFSDHDRSIGKPLRCTPVRGTESRGEQLKRLYPNEPGFMDAPDVIVFGGEPPERGLGDDTISHRASRPWRAPPPPPSTPADHERLRLAAQKRARKAARLRKANADD